MSDNKNGMNYAPKGKPNPVVSPGEFHIAAIGLDHGHIYGMCNGLVEAGKDYFTDKAPLTTLDQLAQGAIGTPIHIDGFGPPQDRQSAGAARLVL